MNTKVLIEFVLIFRDFTAILQLHINAGALHAVVPNAASLEPMVEEFLEEFAGVSYTDSG